MSPIEHFTKAAVALLIVQGEIREEDAPLYEYGVTSMLIQGLPLLLFVIAISLAGVMPEGVLFLCGFILTRIYAGGYHAQQIRACFILSLLTLAGGLAASMLLPPFLSLLPSSALIAVTIWKGEPMDHPNKPLSEEQKRRNRVILRGILIGILVITVLSISINPSNHVRCVVVGAALALVWHWFGRLFEGKRPFWERSAV